MSDVTISVQEYFHLCERSDFLGCLEQVGVDEWEGYANARRLMEEEYGDE